MKKNRAVSAGSAWHIPCATAETAVSLGELFVLEYAGARRG